MFKSPPITGITLLGNSSILLINASRVSTPFFLISSSMGHCIDKKAYRVELSLVFKITHGVALLVRPSELENPTPLDIALSNVNLSLSQITAAPCMIRFMFEFLSSECNMEEFPSVFPKTKSSTLPTKYGTLPVVV